MDAGQVRAVKRGLEPRPQVGHRHDEVRAVGELRQLRDEPAAEDGREAARRQSSRGPAVMAGAARRVRGRRARGISVTSLNPSRTRPRPSMNVSRSPPDTSARSSRPATTTRSWAVGPSKITRSIVALDDVLEAAVLAVLDDDQVLRSEVDEDAVADAHVRSEPAPDLEPADVDPSSRLRHRFRRSPRRCPPGRCWRR